MQTYPAGQVEKNGQTVDIAVTEYGTWVATVSERGIHADTRDKLVEGIAAATRRAVVKVDVPFTLLTGAQDRSYGSNGPVGTRSGTATGFHSSNGNILVTWDDGSKEQLKGHEGSFTILLTEEGEKEFVWLANEARAAKESLEYFLKNRSVNIREVVQETIDRA